MPTYRSHTTTQGRNMAGARALWRATGMKDGDVDKPIIAVVNSFTQFVPGHVHLKDLGQLMAREIEAAGGVAKEFNTIAVDDGIAMGHGGMLYSLPSRDLIGDSVEYMVNAHRFASNDLDRSLGCIRDRAHAYSEDGGLAVLYGNIAQKGCIVKTAGVDASILTFSGKARVFESQDAAVEAILNDAVQAGDVVVIRYEGPKGGPGMQEMLYPTSYIKSKGLGKSCALFTDGRFSGGSSGLVIGHASPEAAEGGAIGLVEEGDTIDIYIPARTINLRVSSEALALRRAAMEARGPDAWQPVGRERYVSQALQAYAALTTSADRGAVRDLSQLKR